MDRALAGALMDPLLQLVDELELPLGALQQIVEEYYFARLRKRFVVERCAERLQVSLRKAFQISKRVRTFDPGDSAREPSKEAWSIVRALTARPATLRQLVKALKLKPKTVATALEALEQSGHVSVSASGVYKLRKQLTRMVDDDGTKFLHGIQQALRPVGATIATRRKQLMSGTAPSSIATARVYAFAATTSTLQRDVDIVTAGLLANVNAIDASADAARARGEATSGCEAVVFWVEHPPAGTSHL